MENMNNKRIIGKDLWISNDDLTSGYNNNDLIVGGSGSGKTGGYVIPNIKNANSNLLVTDTKSQLVKKLRGDLERKGYTVKVIDFANPEKSMSYNPIEYIRVREVKEDYVKYSSKDIVSLARILVPSRIKHDPFWEESARTVVSFLIAFTLEAFVEGDHSMVTVAELYHMLQDELGVEKMKVWCMENPDSYAARKFHMFESVMSVDKTWACIMQFVAEAIEPFDFEEADDIFAVPTSRENAVSILDLCDDRTVVFLNVSDIDRYADVLVSLIYAQAFQILFEEAEKMPNGRLKTPVRFILDDFASSVYIDNFDKIISVIRSRNISVSVILQSLSQLDALYTKGQANTIITNCDHLLYLGGQDINTASYIGHRSNKTEDNVMLMPAGKAYFIERGKRGILIDRVPPYEEKNLAYDSIFDEDELIFGEDLDFSEDMPF